MIGADDFYNVMCAMVPLYVAMFLAYGSVKWWGIFTPEQCSGINRFVAVFAVPVLSFHFISQNNPYKMDGKFILADSISKVLVLTILGLWTKLSSSGSLEWMITLFSLATLPNTLVMGIPLLRAMYGDFTESLMVQLVVLQCIIWYTLLLFLFEYRGARLLVTEQFPDTAASIISFKVDGDVVSLDGREPLQTEAEVGDDGKIRVKIRRSTSSRSQANGSILSSGRSQGLTPRPSNLTGAEIYSIQSSRANTPGPDLSFSHMEHHSTFSARAASPRHSNLTCSDVYSLQSSRGPTPRTSNFNEDAYRELNTSSKGVSNSPRVRLPSLPPPSAYTNLRSQPGKYSPMAIQGLKKPSDPKTSRVEEGGKEFHMFIWSAAASPGSEAGLHADNQNNETKDVRMPNPNTEQIANGGMREPLNQALNPYAGNDFSFGSRSKFPVDQESAIDSLKEKPEASPKTKLHAGKLPEMPRSTVMLKLILTMVGRKLARNPNTYSSLLGLLWSLVSFRWNFGMPSLIKYSIKIISDAGLGMAMFSLGLFMALQRKIIACGTTVAVFGMAVRFLTGPAIMSAASIAVGLRGVRLHTAIVQAALPQGIVPFVFAREYGVHPDILSTGVIFGMLISLPITLLYYIFLGL